MKKWKTLKVLLGVLCAVLASVGLFACKKGGANDIANITRVQGASNLSFTDNEQWSDIVSSLENSVKLTCKPTKGENFELTGKDCNFTATIEFDEADHCKVGYYTITIQPKTKNSKKISRDVDVEIVHDFKADGDREVCGYCKATKISAVEDTIAHFGSFHEHGSTYNDVSNKVYGTWEEVEQSDGSTKLEMTGDDGTAGKAYTNKKANSNEPTYIEQFGTVQTKGGVTYTMPTLTAGRLEPGMTITVKGNAKAAWSQWGLSEDKGYFFPVIGFADRFLNDPAWDGGSARTDYVGGGTSVMVRGEGWVLYNGMDSSHADGSPVRMLSGLGTTNSGSGTSRNYASHELAEQASDENRPTGYVQGQIPDVDKWTDWVAYSMGTTSNSGSYSELTPIELTWNYREDGVIELIYNVNGSKLVAMVKVPVATRGYYDTILHGDYVDMYITSYERIETRTPSAFEVNVETANNANVYYEGQQFNPDVTLSAQFQYEQTGNEWFTQALSLDNIFASTNADADPETASDWVSLKDNPVSFDYNVYKVEIVKGGETWHKTFTKDQLVVVKNLIESVNGVDNGSFKNNNTVGELALSTDGTDIILTPKGDVYAQAIPNGVSIDGTDANHRYVSLQIGTSKALGETLTVNVPYAYDKTNGYLVLALTKDTKTVTVEGLQESKTVFDFSKAMGFNVISSIVKDEEGNAWKLNNNENVVTVTFKAATDAALARILINGATYRISELEGLTEDEVVESFGYTLLHEGTGIEDGTVTLKVSFRAAKLNAYSEPTISVVVGTETDFVYAIDYKPEFVADEKTVDMGYYTFVADGKIYLAKAAESGDHALTLNVNEGNDNVALIDLAYNYANGNVAFKNAVKGAAISTVKVAKEDVILIEVDPASYNVSTTKFGYQIKTANFSDNYFAVVNNVAKITRAEGTEMLVINEGSCLEQGIAGTLNKTTVVGSEEVTFLTNLSEFGGSHKFASLADGQKCQLCGQELKRARLNNIGALTLTDNEFIEVTDSYKNTSDKIGDYTAYNFIYSGATLRLTAGSDWYWFRNDGFIGFNDYGAVADGDNVWSSLDVDGDTALRTPSGKLDADGNEIDEDSFKQEMKNGATFRIWAGYQDGTFTLIWRLYKVGDATQVTGYGKVYYEFTHKISNITADTLNLTFGFDNSVNAGNTGNLWWFKNGTIDRNMIESVVDEDERALTIGNVVDHLATVSATGGNVWELSDEDKEAGGLDDKYVNAVGIHITFKESYSIGKAFGKLYDAAHNVVEDAVVEFSDNNTKVSVLILLEEGEKLGEYYLDLGDDLGSSKQLDIKLDLKAISIYQTQGNVTNNAKIIAGGNVEIVYTDLPEDMTGVEVSVNGNKAALGATMNIEGVKTASWDAENATLTLTLPQVTNLTDVPQYTVALVQGENAIVTNVFNLTAVPTEIENGFVREDGVYGYAEGDKLYLYLIGEKASGTDYLVFNANYVTADSAKDKILPYDLAFSVNGANVSFTTANALTDGGIVAKHITQGSFKVTQFEINLATLGIGADTAYYFDVLTAKIAGSATYYSVSDGRAVTPHTVESLGSKKPIVDNSCTSVGTQGYEITSGTTVVGYYGVEVVPSHTYVQNATDATLFECSVCHAIVASGNATGKVIPLPKLGDDSIVNTGISISLVVSGATGDWGSFIAQPTDTGFALTLPNFDQWNHTVADANVSAELKAEAAKYKSANGVPVGDEKKNGHEWDTFLNVTSYLTLTISKNGINYYQNGELAISYAADKIIGQGDCGGFAETFLGLVEVLGLQIAKSGCHADDALVQRGVLTEDEAKARYNLYLAEKDYLPVPHEHEYTNADHTCHCGALDPLYDYPTYSTTNTFDVGVAAKNEAKTLAWVNYIQKGEKFVFTGTHKSDSNDNWAGINVALGSYKSVDSITLRVDRWADGAVSDQNDNGGKVTTENWTFTKSNTGFNDWAGVHRTARKDGNVTVTVDWTTETQIAVTIALENGGTTTAFTYTFTATAGSLRDRYNFSLGCGLSYSSLTVTEAPTRTDAPTAVTPEA